MKSRQSFLVASTLAAFAFADVAAGQDAQLDMSSVRVRYGTQRIEALKQLPKPEFYGAQEITQELQTQEWDCPARRFRIRLRVYMTSDGRFVRSERDEPPWSAAPTEGPEGQTFRTMCPVEAAKDARPAEKTKLD